MAAQFSQGLEWGWLAFLLIVFEDTFSICLSPVIGNLLWFLWPFNDYRKWTLLWNWLILLAHSDAETIWSHGLVCVEFIKSRVCDMEASLSCLKKVSSSPLPCLLVGNILSPQYHPHRLLLWSSRPSPTSHQVPYKSSICLSCCFTQRVILTSFSICVPPEEPASIHYSTPVIQAIPPHLSYSRDGLVCWQTANVYFMSPGSTHTLSGLSWHPIM